MPLETATYISDLVVTNPANSDGLNQADDHMRLIKSVIKTTFPSVTGAVTATHTQLNTVTGWASAGASLLNHAGTFFDNGSGGASTDGFLNTLAGDIDVQLQGVVAATFQRTGGANFFKTTGTIQVTGGITATAEIKGPGICPPGTTVIWWDDVLPTDGLWAWCNGQVIASANTVAPILLARWGNRFGGNGTTTMGVPDLRDAVPIGKSTMGGVASRGLQTLTNTVLGTLIGLANNVLVAANLPPITSTNASQAIAVGGIANSNVPYSSSGWTSTLINTTGAVTAAYTSGSVGSMPTGAGAFTGNNSISVTSTGTSSTAVNNVQPSTTCNFIVRIG